MNKLDGKCIVDRDKLHMIFNALENIHHEEEKGGYPLHPEMRAFMEHFKTALATDLTGWAAVPVELTDDHIYVAWLKIDDDLENKTLRDVHRTMLNASPPLPTGEKQ
jgi:hypothetical protein